LALICHGILKSHRKSQTGPRQTGLLWSEPHGVKPRSASSNCHVGSAVLWDVTQGRLAIHWSLWNNLPSLLFY